jgi:hypothetical protein
MRHEVRAAYAEIPAGAKTYLSALPSMGEGWEGVIVPGAIHSGTGGQIHPHPGPPPSRGRE